MSEDFHLVPLPADADSGDLLEALGPIEERPPESQYCVFPKRARNDFVCRFWMSKKFWTGRWSQKFRWAHRTSWGFSICAGPSCR